MKKNEVWQRTANENQNEARKGHPTFSSVRLETEEEKNRIDTISKKNGGTRRESLIAAYELLAKELAK